MKEECPDWTFFALIPLVYAMYEISHKRKRC